MARDLWSGFLTDLEPFWRRLGHLFILVTEANRFIAIPIKSYFTLCNDMNLISIPVSLLSLAVSLGTFWLVFVARGRLKMTKPTIVFFGFDTVPKLTPKVFLRTLLFSTAARGHVIEGMHAKVRHSNDERVFSFWGYGETEKLSPGSGLYVSRTGLAANHHFVLSVHEDPYHFETGSYEIDVIVEVVGRRKPLKLATIKILLPDQLANALERHEGVLFERMIGGEYEGHAQKR